MNAPRRSHTPKGQVARERILRCAEKLFAARGFHGTSMRDVAKEARFPLATVIYHFARKERLYAAVLGAIAAQLEVAMGRALEAEGAVATALVRWALAEPDRVALVMRELLDNPARVSRAAQLPLAGFLRTLAAFAAARGTKQPEIAVLHAVGAISYVVVSRPTVRRILGTTREARIARSYEKEAVALVRRTLGS